jgi:hypothetical protein
MPMIRRSVSKRSNIVTIFVFLISCVSLIILLQARYQDNRWHLERFQAVQLTSSIIRVIKYDAIASELPEIELQQYLAKSSRSKKQIEGMVEIRLEQRIQQAIKDLNLGISIPLIEQPFPPVLLELAKPPKYMVLSPRDRVEHTSGYLLREDLKPEQLRQEDQKAEETGVISAYGAGISGIATFPSLVSEGLPYRQTIFTAAHEWVHHYLIFFPLGRTYFSDGKVLNETVADLVAVDITKSVLEKYPELHSTNEITPLNKPDPTDLKTLRRDVDGLLADGRVLEAEKLMDNIQVRWCKKYQSCPRRINQAYLAWIGQYAYQPGSTDPVGDQMRDIRSITGSTEKFLRFVRHITSRQELSALHSELMAAE